jgi:type II secretion system protein C
MRRLSMAILALRFYNVTAALVIVYITLFYFIAPVETEDYAQIRRFRMKPAPTASRTGPRTPETFRAVWETPLPVRHVPPETPKPVEKAEAPKVPPLDTLFALNGTIASDDPRAGMAMLTVLESKEQLMLTADAVLPGNVGVLTGIHKDHIVVLSGKEEKKLYVKDEIPDAPPDPRSARRRPTRTSSRRPTPSRPPLPPVDPRSFRTQRDTSNPNKWNVDRNEKAYLMKNMASLRDEMGIRPVMTGGKMSGVQIENIKQGSLLGQRGLVRGDIIRKINGIAITSEDQGNQLMANPNIRNSSRYVIEVERAGQVFSLTYQINR